MRPCIWGQCSAYTRYISNNPKNPVVIKKCPEEKNVLILVLKKTRVWLCDNYCIKTVEAAAAAAVDDDDDETLLGQHYGPTLTENRLHLDLP